MDECIHAHVQSWTFEDGESARFWSCTACGRKFVPLDLAQERDAERYRWLRDTGDATWRPFAVREGYSAKQADAAIDTAMREGDSNG